MADFLTSRPIDHFFVNPAFRLQPHHHPSNMLDADTVYSGAAEQFNDCWLAMTTTVMSNAKAAATVTHLVDSSMALHGYTSEEESASPTDDDSGSLHSDCSDMEDFPFPETLAGSCNEVQQQCNQAQAVKIQSAGKAKLVSLPRLNDIPSRRGVVRPASIEHRRPSFARGTSTEQIGSARSSQDSHHGSANSSVMNSPASTAPSSVSSRQSIEIDRRSSVASRHVPLMEAARAMSPKTSTFASLSNTSLELHSIGLLKRVNTLSSQHSSSTTSLKLPGKRMNKLSSNFRLNRMSKDFRDSWVSTRGGYLEEVKEPEPVVVLQQARARLSKPKMVARPANERAPTIELPPFPGDHDHYPSDWPLKTGATFPSNMRSLGTKRDTWGYGLVTSVA